MRTFALSPWLALSIAAALAGPGCVPYQKYQDVESELARAAQVNRDLGKQMKEAQVLLAQRGAGEGIAEASYRELDQRYRAILAERDSLDRANKALLDQLNNMPDLFTERFDQNELQGTGFEVGSKGNIVLDAELLFAPGKSELKEAIKTHLDTLAQVIKDKHPESLVHIHGHTDVDDIKKSPHKDNWELGAKRAHAVFAHLLSRGISSAKMRIYSAGSAEPAEGVVDNTTKDGKAKCRRVEVWLSKDS
ncbi:MAG: OmpA family protein [Planctomycetota bacterium]